MKKEIINTEKAPAAIGIYSQAVKVNNTVYVSGQLPIDPKTGNVVSEDFRAQTVQVFKNLAAIAEAAGGSLKDYVKFNAYLTDLSNFAVFNEVMAEFISAPYPARAAVEVSKLPKNVKVEIEGILVVETVS
jgi:reactive intermediate/imine deaminase